MAVIWGVNFVAIDLGLRDTLPLVLVALRFALVAVPLVFLVPKPDAPWRVIVGIGLFMSAGQFGLLFTAMHLGLPAGLAAVVLQCQMIFTFALGAVVLRERPTRMQLVGAALAVVGLGIVALGRLEGAAGLRRRRADARLRRRGPQLGHRQRDLPIGGRRERLRHRGLVGARRADPGARASACSSTAPRPSARRFATIGWPTIASVAYTAGLASLVGYTIWNMLLGRYPAALVAPFALLTPPVGLAAAALLLGQVPNPLELAGSAVLVGGVAVGQLRRRARDPVVRPAWHSRRPARASTLGG